MRAREIIISLVVALSALAGCNKAPEPVGTDMHEFTPEELQKKRLDDAFTIFFKDFNFEGVENPTMEILLNSRITSPQPGILRYTYVSNGVTLITMDVGTSGFSADLHGGIHLEGIGIGDNATKVFIDGDQVATLGLITYNNIPTPVFRFPDGTSYAVTGVLLVEPLIDFLLKNVFSTE